MQPVGPLFLPRVDRTKVKFSEVRRLDPTAPACEALFNGTLQQDGLTYKCILQWLPPTNCISSNIHEIWRKSRKCTYLLQPIALTSYPLVSSSDSDVSLGPLVALMEWFDGIPLNTFLSTRSIQAIELAQISSSIWEAIVALKNLGFYLKDLSCSDILINQNLDIKITNFHLRQVTDRRRTWCDDEKLQHYAKLLDELTRLVCTKK